MSEVRSLKSNKLSAEKRHAVVLLTKEILDQIDEIWALRKRGHAATVSRKMLAETCSILRDSDPAIVECFHENLINFTTKLKAPSKGTHSIEYAEAVQGSRKKLVQNLRENLRTRAA